MHPHSSLDEVQREALVSLYEQGHAWKAAAVISGVGVNASKGLYRRWRLHGRSVLVSRGFKQQYTFEVKLEAVQRFERQEATSAELAEEYGLSSPVQVRTWARIYRREGADGLRSKRKGRPPGTGTTGRKPLTEVQKLEKENERLRAEVAYLKKVRALRAQGLR